MELIKLSRSKSFEMVNGFGLKLWDKLGAEMSVSPGDDAIEAYKIMDDLIEEVHKESCREYKLFEEPIIQVKKPSVKLDPDANVIAQYKQAVDNENESKVILIETIYNTEKLKNVIKK